MALEWLGMFYEWVPYFFSSIFIFQKWEQKEKNGTDVCVHLSLWSWLKSPGNNDIDEKCKNGLGQAHTPLFDMFKRCRAFHCWHHDGMLSEGCEVQKRLEVEWVLPSLPEEIQAQVGSYSYPSSVPCSFSNTLTVTGNTLPYCTHVTYVYIKWRHLIPVCNRTL